MEDYPHKELSHDIIGAGMKALNALKPGLDEKIYENAMVIEARLQWKRVVRTGAVDGPAEGS